MAENNFSTANARPVEMLPNFSSYKYGPIVHPAVQSQHFTITNSHPNGMPSEYITSDGGTTTVVDVNSNYPTVPGAYATALQYFTDSGIANSNCNNNNNTNFPNQNLQFPTKYSTEGVLKVQERNILPQCSGVGIVGAASIVNSTPCQYAHTYGGASCFNRNRYMPYNHSRACAAAASAVAMGMAGRNATGAHICHSKIPVTMSTTASNVAIVPPLVYTSYQQFASNYPHFPPLVSQPTIVGGTQVGLESVNPIVMTSYDQGTSTALSDCSHYTFVTQPNIEHSFLRSNSIGDTDTSMQTSMPYTSAATSTTACTSLSGSLPNPNTQSSTYSSVTNLSQVVSLRLTNLDYTMDEESLRKFLLAQLKPITPVVSLTFEDSNFATVTVPDSYFAKQVVANLHRKKIGHKRMVVSYTRDSSLTEANTLRCQVAGLLKDVPYNRLPMYKFRELFQSRFKTSISVLDLYTMRDICIISADNNEEKFITLQPGLASSLENSPLMEGLQHTVPYCTEHFKREQKGWAEQEIEPLPNVFMTIAEIQNLIYPLLKNHHGDIPVSSLMHCIEGQMNVEVQVNDNGVNLEHLVCCIQGVKVQMNNFGIKILGWFDSDRRNSIGSAQPCQTNNNSLCERGLYFKSADPLSQITREVIELVKMSPKATMKFSRFIPAYHNHFGKQCRVADYGYTKLIELFEALFSVVQIMGDGENRQITLTHRTQIRRFTSDLLRILRSTGNKSILLSELPQLFTKTQGKNFDVTDYGVCEVGDILDGLVNSNVVVVSKVQNEKDILISIPKRQQTSAEIAKTCVFAGEMVELFRNAPQYTILFQKFVRSYHYHFAYQCRLSDYGFLKLADLMEAIHGVVEMDRNNDEDRRIYLSPQMARRVFAEQCEELIRIATGSSKTSIKLDEVLKLHKKKYGYQIQPEILGVGKLKTAIELLPYVEVFIEKTDTWIICHNDDPIFRTLCYRACKHLLAYNSLKYRTNTSVSANTSMEKENIMLEQKRKPPSLDDFIIEFNAKFKENLNLNTVKAMRYAIEIYTESSVQCVRISKLMEFIINIVRLLEQRSLLLLSEIKNSVNCTINTTFLFGHPSLYTLLTSYPDIFIVNLGVCQETSEVRLAPNCELATMQRNRNETHKVSNNSSKLHQGKSHPPRFARPVLADCNGRNPHNNCNGPPLAKIRNIMPNENQSLATCDFKPTNLSHNNLNHNHNNNNAFYQQPFAALVPASIIPVQNISQSLCSSYNSYSSGANYSLSHNSSLLNSSFLNISSIANKENSFNGSFNSSNTSLSDLNSSLAGFSSVESNYNTSKLWERRKDMGSFYNTNNNDNCLEALQKNRSGSIVNNTSLPPLKIPKLSPSLQSPPKELIAQNSLYGILNSIQNGLPSTPMYDPPKPDSPPTHNMPFWIDPVWSHNINLQPKSDMAADKSPAGQQTNNLPMVLSPYTLSKIVNMNKAFNFEGMDRKIA